VCLYTAAFTFLLCLTGSFKSLITKEEVHGKSSMALISLDWIANLIYNLMLVKSLVCLLISSPAFFGFLQI